MKYVITAYSKLLGGRFTCSGKHSEEDCQQLLRDWKERRRGKRNLPFVRLRIEPAVEEGSLFTPPDPHQETINV